MPLTITKGTASSTFPGHCWLRRRGESCELPGAWYGDIASLAAAFDALLEQAGPLRGARLDVIVSDRSARIAALPWQSKLRSKSEWQAYAGAAFDANGMSLDEGWVCVPALRRYGEQGLAVAVPAAWLAVLEETARRHGARLRSVMPLTVAAYWAPRGWMSRKESSWLVLEEESHATVLCFHGRSSTAHDTQPTFGEHGLRQLLQRRLLVGSPASVRVWHAGDMASTAVLAALVPDASVHPLPHDYWDRHA